jgi:CheY-like chemotaxis protein
MQDDMSDNKNNAEDALETILVVEDKVLERAAISEYLRHCGYNVIEAASADEALTLLNESHISIDIVFSVVEMPGSMDGFAFAQWIRANKPGIHIILTSDIVKAAQKAGDLCEEGPHLKKPYAPEALVDWIKRLRALKK